MPRASNGNYTLPAGNPVVTLTTISSTWANNTLSDLATAMTDSLSRSGDGPMLAPLALDSGLIGAPGLSWSSESTSGLYRAAAGDFRYSISSADVLQLTAAANKTLSPIFEIENAAPRLFIDETDAPANERIYDFASVAGQFVGRTRTDADGAGITWLQINRTGTTVDDITLASPLLIHSGADFRHNSAAPRFLTDETDAPANERIYDTIQSAGDLLFRTRTDADGAGATFITVSRTGTVVDSIALAATAITLNGVAVSDYARLSQANTFTNLTPIIISNALPRVRWTETDATADNQVWYASANGEQFSLSVVNDALSVNNPVFTVSRTGTTVGTVTFASTQILNASGSATTPGYSFTGDTDCGMYRIGGNDIGFTAGNALRFEISSSAVSVIGVPLLNNDAAVGTPSYSFTNDTDTGFYRIGADNPGLALGGNLEVSFTASETLFGRSVAADRAIGLTANAGQNRDINFRTAGTLRWRVRCDNAAEAGANAGSNFQIVALTDAGGALSTPVSIVRSSGLVTLSNIIQVADGAVGGPAYSFSGDSNTGLYRIGADQIGFSTGGTLRLDVSTTAVTATLVHLGPDGAVGGPSYSFSNDTDTGIYRVGVDTIAIATGGTARLTIGAASVTSTLSLLAPAGSAATPSISFSTDADTGFYTDTGNQIGITLSGTTAGQIAQGSFTGTLTGYAANPTGTVQWQRIGNIVTLWVTAAITATSNANTLTMTGLPAAVQPASIQITAVAHGSYQDNSAPSTTYASISAGTITFFRMTAVNTFGSSSWTAGGTKGLNAGWSISYPVV